MPLAGGPGVWDSVFKEDNYLAPENEGKDGKFGASRSLKRSKTFTNSKNVLHSRTPNRHRRGAKGRHTLPISSTPQLPNKRNDPLEPLRIQTGMEIFEEAFGKRKRNSLTSDQVSQLAAALALPEKCQKAISPTARSITSSSGFGSTDDQLCSPGAISPKHEADKVITKSSGDNQSTWFHFWFVICVQYLLHYLRDISIRAKRRPENTPTAFGGNFERQKFARKAAPDARFNLKDKRVRRKLFEEEEKLEAYADKPPVASRKAFYTELHLGRENQRLTSLAAIEANRSEYPSRRFIDRAQETKYVTTVFEIRYRGIEEIADSVKEEMERWYGQEGDGLLMVCCELQWSTPDRYRNIPSETRMKDEVMKRLRVNNRRVLDAVARRNEKLKKFDQFLILPDSVTEELTGRNLNAIGCFGGSYRRYYDGLLPWGHREAAAEHQPWWELKKHAMPEAIKWPLIASPDKISVIMLNLVCLKLDQL